MILSVQMLVFFRFCSLFGFAQWMFVLFMNARMLSSFRLKEQEGVTSLSACFQALSSHPDVERLL